jgi:hypothetical protein
MKPVESSVVHVALTAIRPSGERFPIIVEIGHPYPDGSRDAWRCPVSLADLDPALPDLAGGDALQALCIVIMFIRRRLSDFVEAGGRLYLGGAEDLSHEFPLEAYFGK